MTTHGRNTGRRRRHVDGEATEHEATMNSSPTNADSQVSQPKPLMDAADLPDRFLYPESYRRYVQLYPRIMEGLQPWGYVNDPCGYTREFSPACGKSLVVFAQAYSEDQLAGFEVIAGEASGRVLVLDPWRRSGPLILAECGSFDEWLSWAQRQIQERFE
jgi:hypothetical protein